MVKFDGKIKFFIYFNFYFITYKFYFVGNKKK